MAVTPAAARAHHLVLEIDDIAAPRRRVEITQIIHGPVPAVGSRVYVLIDAENPATVALVPMSTIQGQATLPAGANRLDPVVLGPRLLRDGAKGSALVRSATAMAMSDPSWAKRGISRWQLVLDVTPENGAPAYQATLTIALTSPEKVERMAKSGVQVPIRYDPADPQTLSIDSIAMGYGDPYESAKKIMAQVR